MFGWLHCWRLKRRQHALAMAWCGDSALAAWLVARSRARPPCLRRVESYRRMAACWLEYVRQCGAQDDKAGLSGRPGDGLPADAQALVRSLIAGMPMEQRMTLSLVEIAHLSYRDTASVMGIGLFDVQYHIASARRQLLHHLRTRSQRHIGPAATGTTQSC